MEKVPATVKPDPSSISGAAGPGGPSASELGFWSAIVDLALSVGNRKFPEVVVLLVGWQKSEEPPLATPPPLGTVLPPRPAKPAFIHVNCVVHYSEFIDDWLLTIMQ